MADEKKDTPVVVAEELKEDPKDEKPKGKPATTIGNINDWGEPLTITVPAPFADIARGFLQRLNSNRRHGGGPRNSRGPPRGRGRSPQGRGGKCQKGNKDKTKKWEKKVEKLQNKLKNAKKDKEQNENEEVDKEIEKLRKEIEIGEGVHAADDNNEVAETDNNEMGFDTLPRFIQQRVARARANNETIPEWVLGLLSTLNITVDDVADKHEEEEEQNAKKEATEDEDDKFDEQNEDMPNWLKMGKEQRKEWKKKHKDFHKNMKHWKKQHNAHGPFQIAGPGCDDDGCNRRSRGPPGNGGRRSWSPGPHGRGGRGGPHHGHGGPGRFGPGGPGFRMSKGKRKMNIGPFEIEVDMKYTETEKRTDDKEAENEAQEPEAQAEQQPEGEAEKVEEEEVVENERINEIMGGLTQKELEQIFELMKKEKKN